MISKKSVVYNIPTHPVTKNDELIDEKVSLIKRLGLLFLLKPFMG